MKWSLLVDGSGRPGHVNMNTDFALLRAAQEGVGFVRVYRWEPACLSFGRNEPARRRYDRNRIEALGLDTVRRPTGGRAVWHEHEVTYAVAAPNARFGSLRDAYREIHGVVGRALATLGARVEMATRDQGPLPLGAGACFAAPVGGEITIEGRKVVGSAQYRLGPAFLQHGSILLRDGQAIIQKITREAGAHPQAGALETILARTVSFEEVATALSRAVRQAWPGTWREEKGSNLDMECYNFDAPEWTWRR